MQNRKLRFLNEPKRRALQPAVIKGHCPMVRYRAAWCRYLCDPLEGRGACGRLAPHSMLGKSQAAIITFRDRHGHTTHANKTA